MRFAKTWAALVAPVLALALVGGSLTAAHGAPGDPALPQSNGSEGGLFVFSHTGTPIDDPSYIFARSEPLFGSGGQGQLMAPILGTPEATAGSTESYTFIASAATLRAGGVTAWEAWAPGALPDGGLITPTLTASQQNSAAGDGLQQIFADVGGTYYLGVAFTRNHGITVDSAVYRTMHILSGNRYTLDPVEFEPDAPAPGGSGDGASTLGSETLGGAEMLDAPAATEAFELVAPAAGTIDLGEARRNGTTAESTPLGQFTVYADRSVEPGWQLQVVVDEFRSGEHRIAASALGYEPVAVSALPVGIALGVAKPAGHSGFAPIATGAAGSTTTATGATLDLHLSFAPPTDAAAGAYLSTVSLDLVSG